MFRGRLRTVGLIVLILLVVSGSYLAGSFTSPLARAQQDISQKPPDNVSQQFGIFWEAWNIAQQNFVDRSKLDPKQMTYGAISGMLDSLGDQGHTRFLSPQDVQLEESSLSGSFEGIGAEIQMKDSRPTIVAPLDGSPAQKAGIQAGDVVIAVNGQDTMDMTLSKVVSLVRGPKGTTVTLTVMHPSDNSTTDIPIVRDQIQVQAVTWHYLANQRIAHVKISEFSQGASDALVTALQQIKASGAQGIIVDLRNDPGGLVDEVMNISSQFLPAGSTVYIQQDSQGNQQTQVATAGGLATAIPMVVLIDQGSASASEIFSGAIKDNHRGYVIGQRTFGTGTVLDEFKLSDGSAMLLGIAEWLTPSGALIKGKGITPDQSVKLAANVTPLTPGQEASMTDAQIAASQDAQLSAAIDYLTKQQNGQQQNAPLDKPAQIVRHPNPS